MKKEHWGLFLGFIILATICAIFVISADKSIEESEETDVAVEDKVLTIDEIKFDNGAFLFVPAGYDTEEEESILSKMADKHNFKYEKINFDESAEKFMAKQEEIVNQHYPVVMDLANKIFVKEVDGKKEFDQPLSEKANTILQNILTSEKTEVDNQKEIEAFAKENKKDFSLVKSYFSERVSLSEVVISKPLTKKDGPTLLLFNEGTEYSRIHLNQPENVSFEWLLVTKGVLSLNETQSLEQLKTEIKGNLEDETQYKSDYVVAFATHTCENCENSITLSEKVSADKGVSFRYIDAATFANGTILSDFTKNHLDSPLETSPTIVYLHKGKEMGRFIGTQTEATIEKFIRDMQNKVEKQSTENTEPANVEEVKENTQPVKAEEVKENTEPAKVKEVKQDTDSNKAEVKEEAVED